MSSLNNAILTINGGLSSLKFALYQVKQNLDPVFTGSISGIGSAAASFTFHDHTTDKKTTADVKAENTKTAAVLLIKKFEQHKYSETVTAIGHRVVHGMRHTKPEKITTGLIHELKSISAVDPEHLPGEIELMEIFMEHFKDKPQIACFDTAFHATMPPVARRLPIPRIYSEKGIERYGFHGLSYTYLMQELERVAGKQAAHGKVILAHLGNGASMAAVKEGKPRDTSMGFTPVAGLPMSTRTGDLDPGAAAYLMQSESLNAKEFNTLINHQSGLLGISETSSNLRDLLQLQHTDPKAAEAVEFFCYQAKKWIGAYTAVLGGLDTLVFAGGIGEHLPEIRQRITAGLQYLGIEIDEDANATGHDIISTVQSKVLVRVMATNEELMIARLVSTIMNYDLKN